MNVISFKVEEDGGIAAAEISGKVIVTAINLLNKDGQIKSLNEKDPASPVSRYTINDTTDTLANVNFKTNDDGYVNINLSSMLTNTAFIKFYRKYNVAVTLSLTIEIPKTDIFNVFVSNIKITPNWDTERNTIAFEDYDYYQNDDTIILSPISDKITDLATLRQTYNTVQETYLLVKKQFESQTAGDIDLEIDTVEDYEPKTFKNVITRLLEFQLGTLTLAIDYTKTAKLTTEYERLTTINKLINVVCKMYPSITIDDGEGIPYDNGNPLEIATE
jgi:hypothetical protein